MSDIWNDPPPVYYDNEERFGTGPEMIAEIRRLRATIQEILNLGCVAPEVVAKSFFANECQQPFSAFRPENRTDVMISGTLTRLTELIRRARVDGANEARRAAP